MTKYLHVVTHDSKSKVEAEPIKTIEWTLVQEDGYIKLRAKGPDGAGCTVLVVYPDTGVYRVLINRGTDVHGSLPVEYGRIRVLTREKDIR
jgi:hypothetical protein|tara:strand:- start:7652 stop:7924 length:273 start_codon:yes stop_codon:yes gene_type:complete